MSPHKRGALLRWRGKSKKERVATARHAANARWAGLTAEERKIERARGFSGAQAIPLLTLEQKRQRQRENYQRWKANKEKKSGGK